MSTNFFINSLSLITRSSKWQLHSGIQKRLFELLNEENWWQTIRIRQLKEDMDRDERERKSAEIFNRETFEIIVRRRRSVFKARCFAKKRKQLAIKARQKMCNTKVCKRDAKTDAEFVDELITKQTPEDLRKWLYRNLCLVLAPKKQDDPDWKKKNVLFQEVVLNRNDLKRLKEISEKHKPEWSLFFMC